MQKHKQKPKGRKDSLETFVGRREESWRAIVRGWENAQW